MIKSSELRVGSWVNYLGTEIQLDKHDLSDLFNDNIDMYEKDLEPIELTEEILLKCGFEKKDHLFKLYLLNSISIGYNSECNLWYFDIYMNTSRVELQCLHELQNIYNSITSKELEIEL